MTGCQKSKIAHFNWLLISLPSVINKTHKIKQEAQLSQRGRAMLGGSEYFTKPLKVTENGTIRNLGTVFHWRCIATMAVSLAFRHNTGT